MIGKRIFLSVLALWLCVTPTWPLDQCQLQDLELRGAPDSIDRRAELSGVAMRGQNLLVLSNELIGPNKDQQAVQVFKPDGNNAFKFDRDQSIALPRGNRCKDADFEAMALSGDRLYVAGSHSSAHKKQNSNDSYKQNRKALVEFKTDKCDGRYTLAEYKIDADASINPKPRHINMRREISRSKLLSAFSVLPSKENGVDIEGLAISGDKLFIGFRGPVLRENFVPILRMNISGRKDAEFLFVKLGGRGVRDIVSVADGFLIIGGPVGDQDWSFVVYHWDGKDEVTGKDRPDGGKVKPLCTLPREGDGKPEGIAVVSRSSTAIEAIIVYDSNTRLIAKRATISVN